MKSAIVKFEQCQKRLQKVLKDIDKLQYWYPELKSEIITVIEEDYISLHEHRKLIRDAYGAGFATGAQNKPILRDEISCIINNKMPSLPDNENWERMLDNIMGTIRAKLE